MEKTFDGKVQRLYVNGTNMPDVQSAIEAKLQTDKSVDRRRHPRRPLRRHRRPGQARAPAARPRSTPSTSTPRWPPDWRTAPSRFAVDQQPYLQGYEAVDLLWLYKYNADVLGGGRPVLTGPQIITKDDAAALADYTKRGTR
ncbi:Sugar ABC transporter substrate-binding protein OS=Streptomyces tendae OX=1932 GN=GUR47_00220 PE=4 SV=1 [Streptomyces tendae]